MPMLYENGNPSVLCTGEAQATKYRSFVTPWHPCVKGADGEAVWGITILSPSSFTLS